ncbi:MAG: hypothetical protein ACK4ND_18350 [Cytophagaceae bacterium]
MKGFKFLFTILAACFLMESAHGQVRENIDEYRSEGGTVISRMDDEINAYVQGSVEIDYKSYPWSRQPDMVSPKPSQDNPLIIVEPEEGIENHVKMKCPYCPRIGQPEPFMGPGEPQEEFREPI